MPGIFYRFDGRNLRKLREERGLSRELLAVSCGVGYQQIYSLETRLRNPSRGLLLRLAAVLQVQPSDLLKAELELDEAAR